MKLETKHYLPANRIMERMKFPLDELDVESFPPLEPAEQELLDIEHSCLADYSFVCFCSPYVREKEDGSWFVDLYFSFDKTQYDFLLPEEFSEDNIIAKRLIIAPGMRMTEKDEAFMENVIRNSVFLEFNERLASFFFDDIQKVAPELHLIEYFNMGWSIRHVYYASHRSGLREQLYKAGLTSIACYLETISDYKLFSTNIEDAFQLPLSLIRKLNYMEGIRTILPSKRYKRMAKYIYKKYHGYLNEFEFINVYQLRYLYEVTKRQKRVDTEILRTLSTIRDGYNEEFGDLFIEGEKTFNKYIEYLSLLNELGKEARKNFPQLMDLSPNNTTDLFRLRDLHSFLKSYVDNSSLECKRYSQLSRRWSELYSYHNDHYIVLTPHSLLDVYREGCIQKNCLQEIIEEDNIFLDSIILFVRKTESPNKPYITLEIIDDNIVQAKKKNNSIDFSEEEWNFLTCFFEKKGLNLSSV